MSRGRKTILLVYTSCDRNTAGMNLQKRHVFLERCIFVYGRRIRLWQVSEKSIDDFRKYVNDCVSVTGIYFIICVSNTVQCGCRPLPIVCSKGFPLVVLSYDTFVVGTKSSIRRTSRSCWVSRGRRKCGHSLNATGRNEDFKRSHVSFQLANKDAKTGRPTF